MGTYYSPRIVTDGLVLCLDAANPKSYPGTGTTWKDISGNGHDGTLGSATTFDSSGYMSFGGSNTNCEVVVSSVSMNTTADEGNTIEQWIYSNGRQGNGNMPFTFYNLQLDLWHSNDYYGINNGSSLVYGMTGADSVLENNWVHSVFYIPYSWSSDYLDAKMWINGVSQTMAVRQGGLSNRQISSSQTVGIGGGYTSGGDLYNWNGRISVTKIYNRELIDAEVKQNFNATRGRYGI